MALFKTGLTDVLEKNQLFC